MSSKWIGSDLPDDDSPAKPVARGKKKRSSAPGIEWEEKKKPKKDKSSSPNKSTLKLSKAFLKSTEKYFPEDRIPKADSPPELVEEIVAWFNSARLFVGIVLGLPLHADQFLVPLQSDDDEKANRDNRRVMQRIHSLCVVARAKVRVWQE